jgi:hypothetical protein
MTTSEPELDRIKRRVLERSAHKEPRARARRSPKLTGVVSCLAALVHITQ